MGRSTLTVCAGCTKGSIVIDSPDSEYHCAMPARIARSDRPRLSDREEEVLIEWFQCDSRELVAERLGISPHTVTTYLDRVRLKYANVGRTVHSKTALVARAIQDGLIRAEDL